MLCPFCLTDVRLKLVKPAHLPGLVHLCPICNEQVPALYAQDYRKYPPVIVSAVGFRQHGKTVYFAALFYTLKRLTLARDWPSFFTISLDEDSLDTVYGNARLLEGGALPNSTPKNFPRPTLIRVEGMPIYPDCSLLFFDTGGECFEKPTQLVQFASFVRQARTAMLLISIPDLVEPRVDMHQLLNNYIVGIRELGGRTESQDLIVVYTKADRFVTRFIPGWEGLHYYLIEGSVYNLAQPDGYVQEMFKISEILRDFTEYELHAHEFINAATAHFKSVNFSLISALGTEPEGARLTETINPLRIIDPLLWTMEKSLAHRGWSWQRWWKGVRR